MATLELVWCNPSPVQHPERRLVQQADEQLRYVVQECAGEGEQTRWVEVSGFEVLPGGRAA